MQVPVELAGTKANGAELGSAERWDSLPDALGLVLLSSSWIFFPSEFISVSSFSVWCQKLLVQRPFPLSNSEVGFWLDWDDTVCFFSLLSPYRQVYFSWWAEREWGMESGALSRHLRMDRTGEKYQGLLQARAGGTQDRLQGRREVLNFGCVHGA